MSKADLKALMQQAPEKPAASAPAPEKSPRPRVAKASPAMAAKESRDGLVNVSSWQPPLAKQNLLMLKAMGKGDIGALHLEALNLLFKKHNLPTIGED